jgi:hypothetical protein
MKGFRPTGYGPSAGFKFPTKMGFTGSTGAYTNVSPYVRRKGFANGGFVRQDNPRMKVDSIGDQGSALVRRARSSNALDQESGGKSPLRPGYKKGGRMKKADGGSISNADREAMQRKATADAIRRNKLEVMEEAGMGLSNADREFLQRLRAQKPAPPMKKADGGYIEMVDRRYRVPRRYSNPTMSEGLRAIPPLAKEMARSITSGTRRAFGQKERRMGIHGDLASNYSKGGKAKRMGYADGGATKPSNFDDWNDYYQRNLSGGRYKTRKKLMTPPPDLPKTPAPGPKAKFYAKGGGVSAGQAKKIAERTVGEHVRYPAPKGHKGLEKVMR